MHRAAKGSRRLDLGKLALSLFLNLCSRREHHLNAFQNRDPVTFRKRLESEETFQSKLSVLRISQCWRAASGSKRTHRKTRV